MTARALGLTLTVLLATSFCASVQGALWPVGNGGPQNTYESTVEGPIQPPKFTLKQEEGFIGQLTSPLIGPNGDFFLQTDHGQVYRLDSTGEILAHNFFNGSFTTDPENRSYSSTGSFNMSEAPYFTGVVTDTNYIVASYERITSFSIDDLEWAASWTVPDWGETVIAKPLQLSPVGYLLVLIGSAPGGASPNTIYALDVDTLEVVYSVPFSNVVFGIAADPETGLIYASTTSYSVVCFDDVNAGERVWTSHLNDMYPTPNLYSNEQPENNELYFTTYKECDSIMYSSTLNAVVLSCGAGAIAGLDAATGAAMLFKTPVVNAQSTDHPQETCALNDDFSILVCGSLGNLNAYVLNSNNARELWSVSSLYPQLTGFQQPIIDPSGVVYVSNGPTLQAYNVESGDLLFSWPPKPSTATRYPENWVVVGHAVVSESGALCFAAIGNGPYSEIPRFGCVA